MNRKEAMIAMVNGKKVKHEALKEGDYYYMSEAGHIMLSSHDGLDTRETVHFPTDYEFEEHIPTEEVGVMGYLCKSAIERLANDDFSTALQIRSEPTQQSYIPVKITWEQEVVEH